MKKYLQIFLLILITILFVPHTSFAAEKAEISAFVLPKPKAPDYFVYTDGEAADGVHDDLRMIMVADPEVALLAAEYDRDSEAFREKYGLYSFEISMQYDVSLDDERHWQHTGEWDVNWYNDGIGQGYPYVTLRSEMMEDFEFFWLTYYEGPDSDTFVPYQPAIVTEKFVDGDYEENIYSFDVENHSLYIRCRYYMEWETYDAAENEIGSKQSMFSEWSDSAVFGKDSTQVVPEAPDTYEAPVISGLRIIPPEENESNSHLEYNQQTPESVWMANVYYLMTGDGQFEGLETQISIDDGEWQNYETADSWGDWCISNGRRAAFGEETVIEQDSNVKLRIRFLGTHGPSEWSNAAEVNGGGTNEVPETTGQVQKQPAISDHSNETCLLCGFCSEPFGLCLFLWIAAVLVVILVIVLVILIVCRKRKCPKCRSVYVKKDKFCPECGHRLKK